MGRTYEQIRQLTAQQTGLFWATGTIDSSGSSVSILRDDALSVYGNDRLNGFHVLLTSGSPSSTELHIKDFFGDDGDARFEPELSAAPDSLNYEILPFSGTDFLRAVQDAIYEGYDRGWMARHHWARIMGGSPIYNADFSHWASSTALDGWTATDTTLARERGSANLALSETSVGLTTAAGYLALDSKWKRYLEDFKGNELTFYCWVKTSAGSTARLNLYNGSNNYSAYHGGSGTWELLSVEVDTSTTDTDLEPRLYADTTTAAYFNMPFILGGRGSQALEYPFTIATMPDGPTWIQATLMDINRNEIASGRGLGSIRQLPRQRVIMTASVHKHHDENTGTQVGVLDFSASRLPPREGALMWLRGDGPLTIPTSALSTDTIEVTTTESLLLAKMAAINLLERASAGSSPTTMRSYSNRLEELQLQVRELSEGAGQNRDVATYNLGW